LLSLLGTFGFFLRTFSTRNFAVLTSMHVSAQALCGKFARKQLSAFQTRSSSSWLRYLEEPRQGGRERAFEIPLPGHRFGWDKGEGQKHTPKFRLCAATNCSGLTSGQRKVHLHRGFHLDRLAVEQVRLVFPLLYGFNRGRGQHGVSTDQAKILNVACLADFRL
jgi:hypothetical protein